MSIIKPDIDVLLEDCENDRFLLCTVASKRAHDIQLETAVEIATAANVKPLSMAFEEIARDDISFDRSSIDLTKGQE